MSSYSKFELREFARNSTKNSDLLRCGTGRFGKTVPLTASGRAKNVTHCSRRYECAVCAESGMRQRQVELAACLAVWRASGRSVVAMTLTVPHGPANRLSDVWEWLDAGYASLSSGRPARRLRDDFGVVAVDRTTEVAWSDSNGAHPHLHLLLYVDRAPEDVDVAAMRTAFSDKFLAGARKAGLRRSRKAASTSAVYAELVTDASKAAAYVTKASVRDGKPTGMFALLAEVETHRATCEPGGCKACRRMYAAWRDYVAVADGRRRFSKPKNLRKVFRERGLTVPEDSKEGPTDEVVALVAGTAWDAMVALNATDELMRGAADAGLRGVRNALRIQLVNAGVVDSDVVRLVNEWVLPPDDRGTRTFRPYRLFRARKATRPGRTQCEELRPEGARAACPLRY
jgi:hypothetical protein